MCGALVVPLADDSVVEPAATLLRRHDDRSRVANIIAFAVFLPTGRYGPFNKAGTMDRTVVGAQSVNFVLAFKCSRSQTSTSSVMS